MALPEKRASKAPDRAALARAIEDLLLASGAELDAETRVTPERVAKAFAEDLLDGYASDPVETLRSSLVPAPMGKLSPKRFVNAAVSAPWSKATSATCRFSANSWESCSKTTDAR